MKLTRVVVLTGTITAALTLPLTSTAKHAHEAPVGVQVIALDDTEPSVVIDHQRISLETGVPLALYRPDFPVTPGAPEAMAREFLGLHAEELRLQSPSLDDLRHHHTRAGAVGHTVRFDQTFQGIPVYDATTAVTVRHDATVVFVVNGYKPEVRLTDVTPSITADDALATARAHLSPEGALVHEDARLVIHHSDGVSRLVYDVALVPSVSPVGDWEIFVDAKTGDVVKAVDRAAYIDGTGSLFDPDPLSSAGATYGDTGFEDGGDAGTPQLDAEVVTYTLRDISFDGANYELVGPWAEIRDFEGPFSGTYEQATPDWIANRSPQLFEASLDYWHIDNIMRWINIELGVSCEPFQYTGGARFDPHGLNGADNSHYIGSIGSVAFGDGGVDDGEDADVVIHEMGHAVHDWLTVGGLSQVNGLSEGFGDYLAASYSRSLGQWDPSDPQYQWVFSWDGHNPFWGGRRTNYGASYPSGLTGSIHTDGQIFSTCMMRIWDRIGREKIDTAVFEGLAMTGSSTSQQGAAEAIMQAAIALAYTELELNAIYEEMTTTGYMVEPPVAVGDTEGLSAGTRLLGNRPNPFNPTTTLAYELATGGPVRLSIYDTAGREVTTLVDGSLDAGRHEIRWDGRDADGIEVASGVYHLRLEANGVTRTHRAVLLK